MSAKKHHCPFTKLLFMTKSTNVPTGIQARLTFVLKMRVSIFSAATKKLSTKRQVIKNNRQFH